MPTRFRQTISRRALTLVLTGIASVSAGSLLASCGGGPSAAPPAHKTILTGGRSSTTTTTAAPSSTTTTLLPQCGASRDPLDPTGASPPAGSAAIC
jgi:hypothetical protein